jgi:hypothetical protein
MTATFNSISLTLASLVDGTRRPIYDFQSEGIIYIHDNKRSVSVQPTTHCPPILVFRTRANRCRTATDE